MAELKTFRTEVTTAKGITSIEPRDTVVFMGSCFAENISKKLADGMMDSWANPYGTAYNPMSVGEQMERIVKGNAYTEGDIFKNGDFYYSWLAHTKLRASSKDELKRILEEKTKKMRQVVQKAGLIAITFGTSWTYKLKDMGKIVANCHKMPADTFVRERLTADEITDEWKRVTESLRELNPTAHIVITVSPIRHVKDTMHGNQLSKATLLEAVDRIVGMTSNASYFEAYEIMLDELRDYRFYAEDMVHPSNVAVDYIYERFAEAYMSEEARQMVKEGQRLTQAANHRPIGGPEGNPEYREFASATLKRIEEFRMRYKMNNDVHTIAQLVKLLNDIK